jgi:hypothetical protein
MTRNLGTYTCARARPLRLRFSPRASPNPAAAHIRAHTSQ